MVTALALPQAAMNNWSILREQAGVLVKSGFLPDSIKTPEQALAIMMKGQELGLAPWQALSSINVIKGKPTVSPQLMLALIQRSGDLENIEIKGDDTQCTVMMKRRGQSEHQEQFTMADATRMQLNNKYNWKQMPGIMLKWRAVAACARVVFPDVILGMYTPEEMGADVTVSDSGEMDIVQPAPQLTIVQPEPSIPWHEDELQMKPFLEGIDLLIEALNAKGLDGQAIVDNAKQDCEPWEQYPDKESAKEAFKRAVKTAETQALEALNEPPADPDEKSSVYGNPKTFGDGSEMTSADHKAVLKLATERGYQGEDVNEYLMDRLGKRWWHFDNAQALLDAVSELAMV